MFAKKESLASRRQQIEGQVEEYVRLRAAAELAASEIERLRTFKGRLDADNSLLLTVSDGEIGELEQELREARRTAARAEQALVIFQRERGDGESLGARLREIEAEGEAGEQRELQERYRAKIKELLAAGEAVARLQADIDNMYSTAERRWPQSFTVGAVELQRAGGLRPAGFPSGTFSPAPGDTRSETASSLWAAARLSVALFDVSLLGTSDPALRSLQSKDLSPRVLGYIG